MGYKQKGTSKILEILKKFNKKNKNHSDVDAKELDEYFKAVSNLITPDSETIDFE